MVKNKHCPKLNKPCMRDKCAWFVANQIRVVNIKTHKSRIKDSSNCCLELMGEQAVIKIWEDTERLINQTDEKSDPYENCNRNPLDNCPHVSDGIPCSECKYFKEPK